MTTSIPSQCLLHLGNGCVNQISSNSVYRIQPRQFSVYAILYVKCLLFEERAKSDLMLTKHILSCKQAVQHWFAGQNIQHWTILFTQILTSIHYIKPGSLTKFTILKLAKSLTKFEMCPESDGYCIFKTVFTNTCVDRNDFEVLIWNDGGDEPWLGRRLDDLTLVDNVFVVRRIFRRWNIFVEYSWLRRLTDLNQKNKLNHKSRSDWGTFYGGGGTTDYFEQFCAISKVPMVLVKENLY